MSEPKDVFLEALEKAFRAGFNASHQRLGWTENQAWDAARDQFGRLAEAFDHKFVVRPDR